MPDPEGIKEAGAIHFVEVGVQNGEAERIPLPHCILHLLWGKIILGTIKTALQDDQKASTGELKHE